MPWSLTSRESTREGEAGVVEIVMSAEAKKLVALQIGTAAEVVKAAVIRMDVVVSGMIEAVNNRNTSIGNHTTPSSHHSS